MMLKTAVVCDYVSVLKMQLSVIGTIFANGDEGVCGAGNHVVTILLVLIVLRAVIVLLLLLLVRVVG